VGSDGILLLIIINVNVSSITTVCIVRSTYDSDLQRAKISLKNIINQLTNTVSDDLMISQENRI